MTSLFALRGPASLPSSSSRCYAIASAPRKCHMLLPAARFRWRQPGFSTKCDLPTQHRSEEHTSELQSLMRISYAVFCLKKKKKYTNIKLTHNKYKQQYTKK